MGKILVTGGAGFIGSHTVERLLAEGHVVAVVDNLRTGRLENLVQVRDCTRYKFHSDDILVPGMIDKLVKEFQPEAIIHLAALVSVQESISNTDLNFALNVA